MKWESKPGEQIKLEILIVMPADQTCLDHYRLLLFLRLWRLVLLRELGRRAHQLAPDGVGGLYRPRVEEILVAPVVALRILLVRVVHVEQGQVVTCRARGSCQRAALGGLRKRTSFFVSTCFPLCRVQCNEQYGMVCETKRAWGISVRPREGPIEAFPPDVWISAVGNA